MNLMSYWCNENSVAIVEIKQKAHPNLIDDMLDRKLPNFRTLFPYHQEQKLKHT